MKYTKIAVGIILIALTWKLANTALGLSVRHDVNEVIDEVTSIQGLTLKGKQLLKLKEKEVTAAKASLRKYERSIRQWEDRVHSLDREIGKLTKQIEAGAALWRIASKTNKVAVREQKVDSSSIERDLIDKGSELEGLREEKKAATETLVTIKDSRLASTKTISETSAELIRLRTRLNTAESKAANFALLDGLLSMTAHTPELTPLLEILDMLDDKLYGKELLYGGGNAAPSGIDYLGTGSKTFNIDNIERLIR